MIESDFDRGVFIGLIVGINIMGMVTLAIMVSMS